MVSDFWSATTLSDVPPQCAHEENEIQFSTYLSRIGFSIKPEIPPPTVDSHLLYSTILLYVGNFDVFQHQGVLDCGEVFLFLLVDFLHPDRGCWEDGRALRLEVMGEMKLSLVLCLFFLFTPPCYYTYARNKKMTVFQWTRIPCPRQTVASQQFL